VLIFLQLALTALIGKGRGRLFWQVPPVPSPAVLVSGTNSAGEGTGGTQYGITAKKDGHNLGKFAPLAGTTNYRF